MFVSDIIHILNLCLTENSPVPKGYRDTAIYLMESVPSTISKTDAGPIFYLQTQAGVKWDKANLPDVSSQIVEDAPPLVEYGHCRAITRYGIHPFKFQCLTGYLNAQVAEERGNLFDKYAQPWAINGFISESARLADRLCKSDPDYLTVNRQFVKLKTNLRIIPRKHRQREMMQMILVKTKDILNKHQTNDNPWL